MDTQNRAEEDSATEPKPPGKGEIKPGMSVESLNDALGEDDLSKPKVEKVIRDEQGQLKEVVIEKGLIFRKEIAVPADRLKTVEHDGQTELEVEAEPDEIEKLKVHGLEELKETSLLEQTEQALPTESGLRELEEQKTRIRPPKLSEVLGPGFLAGMAGNDASAVTAYSVDGAQNGYGHLWLMLLSTPLYQAVQYACSKVGRVSQKGLSELLRDTYGGWVASLASLILIIANVALIAADLVAVGSAIELMTGISWVWLVVPVALLLWYITVFQNFETIKKVFLIMSLAFGTYLITAVLSNANWGEVVKDTFVPQLDFNFDSVSSAVALLGATISPYNLFWQVQGQKEEKRSGPLKRQLRMDKWDVGSGVLSGNLVAYAIIVCTAATIFTHHGQITAVCIIIEPEADSHSE